MNHPFKKKEEYIYKDCKIRMSERVMANVMYAVIMTHSNITSTCGIGIYEYNRGQNSYNMVDIRIHIHPEHIPLFENLSGVKLTEPPVFTGQ